MAGIRRQVLFLVVFLSIGLLCVDILAYSLYSIKRVILLCSKRRESFVDDDNCELNLVELSET